MFKIKFWIFYSNILNNHFLNNYKYIITNTQECLLYFKDNIDLLQLSLNFRLYSIYSRCSLVPFSKITSGAPTLTEQKLWWRFHHAVRKKQSTSVFRRIQRFITPTSRRVGCLLTPFVIQVLWHIIPGFNQAMYTCYYL